MRPPSRGVRRDQEDAAFRVSAVAAIGDRAKLPARRSSGCSPSGTGDSSPITVGSRATGMLRPSSARFTRRGFKASQSHPGVNVRPTISMARISYIRSHAFMLQLTVGTRTRGSQRQTGDRPAGQARNHGRSGWDKGSHVRTHLPMGGKIGKEIPSQFFPALCCRKAPLIRTFLSLNRAEAPSRA